MLNVKDVIIIDENQLTYIKNGLPEKKIPMGVYSIIEKDPNIGKKVGAIFTLQKIGSKEPKIIVEWKTFKNSSKWRPLS
jgi:hypothetical protein